jgi:hypothetical protein
MKKALKNSFSRQRRICAVLLISLLSATSVFAQKEQWTIRDYLKNLPEQYKTYSGDYPKLPPADAIVLDEENGYAAILNVQAGVSSTNPYPIFEMALFKRSNGEQIIVVSNTISDSVCLSHETFFLQKRGDSWLDVRARVLPKLTAQMFFTEARLAEKFQATNKKVGNSEKLDLYFAPPRKGTRISVKLDICDYVPDEFDGKISFDEFTENAQSVFLDWDKKRGVFKLAK